MSAIFYQTSPMLLGKHEWRIIVIESRFGGRCTEHQFRATGQEGWKNSPEWPGYNINDGCYLGLPKSLRRLFDTYRVEIKAALAGESQPQGCLPL